MPTNPLSASFKSDGHCIRDFLPDAALVAKYVSNTFRKDSDQARKCQRNRCLRSPRFLNVRNRAIWNMNQVTF